jgi:hypothetical protein
VAYACNTDWRMPRNCGFSIKVSEVGGMEEAVPIARDWVGGEVGRRERIDLPASRGCSKTY